MLRVGMFVGPLIFVLGFNYETPRFGSNRAVRTALGTTSLISSA